MIFLKNNLLFREIIISKKISYPVFNNLKSSQKNFFFPRTQNSNTKFTYSVIGFSTLRPLPDNVSQFVQQIDSMTPLTLSRTAKWAAKQGITDIVLWEKFAISAQKIVDEFQIPDIALFLQALSIRKFRNLNIFTKLSNRLIFLLESNEEIALTPYDITIFISASGRLQISDARVLQLLIPHIYHQISGFRPKDIANIAHAFSKLHIYNEPLFAIIADSLSSYLYDLTPISLANVCKAFSKIDVYHKDLYDKLVSEVEKRISEFGGVEIFNFLLGLSDLQINLDDKNKRKDERLISMIISNMKRSLAPMNLIQYIMVFESFIKLKFYDPHFINARLIPLISSKYDTSRDSILLVDVRIMDCLACLPSMSGNAIQLFHDLLPNVYSKLYFDPYIIGRVLKILKNINCYDYDIFGKVESIILDNREAFVRTVSLKDLIRIHDAFRNFDEAQDRSEIIGFLEKLREKADNYIQNCQPKTDKKIEINRETGSGILYIHKCDPKMGISTEKMNLTDRPCVSNASGPLNDA